MKKAFFIIMLVVAAALFSVSASAYVDTRCLFDDADCLSETTRNSYNTKLKELSEELGFPVMVLITDDIGSNKSDYGAMDYADVYQEGIIGKNQNGIMLMISLDPRNNIYWITTSGACINRFTDYEIDKILDSLENAYGGSLSYDPNRLGVGISSFTASVERYYEKGESFSGSVVVRDITGGTVLFFLVVNVIIIISYVVGVKRSYKISPARGAANYLEHASVRYYQKSDTYIRTYVTKVRIQSSSGGGHGGGSSHRSSGGGRHGGGGRH